MRRWLRLKRAIRTATIFSKVSRATRMPMATATPSEVGASPAYRGCKAEDDFKNESNTRRKTIMRQTFCSRIAGPAALVCAATWAFSTPSQAADFKILQPLNDKPTLMKKGALPWDGYYVPSTADTVMWGTLPNANTKPVLSVPSGSVVTFDTVSHEGVLEDQG